MPHVDEGLLHAYLDGALDALLEAGALPAGTTRDSIEAHLAVCTDCRALLEAERAIRTRAGAVLDTVAPVVAVPPFHELFDNPRARGPRRRVWPLAWAASVLLAVGAGWWGSELFRTQQFASRSVEDVAAPEADRALYDDAARDAAGMAPQQAAVPAAPADLQRAESAGGTPAAAPQAKLAGAEAEAARTGDVVEGRRAGARDTGRADGRVLGSVASVPVVEPAAQARADRAAAPPPSAAAPPPSAPPPPPVAERQSAAANLLGAPAADPRLGDFRRTLAELDAGRIPLSPGAVPPDLPLLRIAGGSAPEVQRGTVPGATLVRLSQRAPGGVEVELIVWRQAALALDQVVVTGAAAGDSAAQRAQRQRAEALRLQRERVQADRAEQARAGAAAPATPPAATVLGSGVLPDGRSELLVRPGGGDVLVALRAPVSAAELQALAARLVEVPRD